jgi:GNAT superfamily N-acetyltransferase
MTNAKIKSASEAEREQAIGVLTLAFTGDPMARWSLPDPVTYLEIFPRLAKAFGGNSFALGSAYLAADASGAALWLPPGERPDEEALDRLLSENAPDNIKNEMPSIFEQMSRFHPTEPHWYLPMIGVDPSRQGNGVGSSLMKIGLEAVDRDGVIAYLESSNPKNIPLYERHGFEVVGEIQAGTSPVLTPMLRKARK